MVGLHCCGDLTPAVLNYFVNTSLACVHSVVLFGCCYHKMSPSCTFLNKVQTCVSNVVIVCSSIITVTYY